MSIESKHGGCIVCGATAQPVLISKTIAGQSVALCDAHVDAKALPGKGQKL